MRLRLLCFFLTIILLLALSACYALPSLHQIEDVLMPGDATPFPAHPLYVLTVSAGEYGRNELLVVDADTWQVTNRTPLLNAAPQNISRDPEGRLWVGYGARPGGDRRVQIFAPEGGLLKTLDLCSDPYLPIHFATGRAFVPCLQTGFYGAVVVIDLVTLEVVTQIDIRIDDDVFLIVASGGDKKYFVVVAGGQKSNRVVLIDTQTLTALDPLLLPSSHPSTVLTHGERFLLLNSVTDVSTEGRQDLLVIDVAGMPGLSTQQLAAHGPRWGVIEGEELYVYHNPEVLTFTVDPFRAISRLNLVTNETVLWPLPDRWNARDLAIVDDEIILAHSIFQEPESSGLYRFDPETGELTMLVHLPGAQRILTVDQ